MLVKSFYTTLCGLTLKFFGPKSVEKYEFSISTSYIERANLSVRHFNKRFARLSLGYSKTLCNHCYAVALFVTAYNFCKVHSTLGCTPSVSLKLATETWTVERLIDEITI